MSPRFAFLLALACAGSLSCGTRTIELLAPEAPVLDIRMELTVSVPGNGTPAIIKAVVRNAGNISVSYVDVCPIPVIRVYDGPTVELLLRDPSVGVPCPVMLMAPLQPGKSTEFVHEFDGTHFSATGERLEAPPGAYRAVATFEYVTVPGPGGSEELGRVTREVPLIWQ